MVNNYISIKRELNGCPDYITGLVIKVSKEEEGGGRGGEEGEEEDPRRLTRIHESVQRNTQAAPRQIAMAGEEHRELQEKPAGLCGPQSLYSKYEGKQGTDEF